MFDKKRFLKRLGILAALLLSVYIAPEVKTGFSSLFNRNKTTIAQQEGRQTKISESDKQILVEIAKALQKAERAGEKGDITSALDWIITAKGEVEKLSPKFRGKKDLKDFIRETELEFYLIRRRDKELDDEIAKNAAERISILKELEREEILLEQRLKALTVEFNQL